MRSDFKKEEISLIKRKNKKTGKVEMHPFPVVGGRLRLFHEDLDKVSNDGPHLDGRITTEIIKYENDVAVIRAIVEIAGKSFSGIGMSSKSRDPLINPAILELAETRAIARALRFAGYGVEYTGAEEMPIDYNVESKNANGSNSQQPVEKTDKPVNGGQEEASTNNAGVNQKEALWNKLVEHYPNVELSELKVFTKDFMQKTLNKYSTNKSIDMDKVTEICLKRWDEFIRAFDKKAAELGLIKKEDTTSTDDAEESATGRAQKLRDYEKKRESVAEASKPKAPASTVNPLQIKKKAELFMSLPDGTNVAAINSFIKSLVDANEGATILDVCEAGLQDVDTFVSMMVDHCRLNSIDPGFPIDPDDGGQAEEPDTKDEAPEPQKPETKNNKPTASSKKEYSDFRKEWINLTWDRFNKYLTINVDRFLEDKVEYEVAVQKFNKMAKNKGLKVKFPFLFSYCDGHLVLDPEQSIIKEEAKTTKQRVVDKYKACFPKMGVKVAQACGIGSPISDDECDMFLDEFEHQVRTFEEKNGKEYSE